MMDGKALYFLMASAGFLVYAIAFQWTKSEKKARVIVGIVALIVLAIIYDVNIS
ncbi:hypothetical protein [Brevibacillus dissolubilis]|uniref:hypothetical protein n=1 Tax=Brevibacillus dissolubilis TaxID=1844116 RepID=UPI00159BC86D|nr:hypothetical protein [Brevibacillus dissolubilis]